MHRGGLLTRSSNPSHEGTVHEKPFFMGISKMNNLDQVINFLTEQRDAGAEKSKLSIRNHLQELKRIKESADDFLPEGAFIAGGALTSAFTKQPIKDIDLYFKSKESFIQAVEDAYDNGMWCLAATDRAVTFASNEHIIQLMHFDFFKNPEEIFDAFDFTVCMAAYDIDAETFVLHDDFLKHAAQRFLRFHSGTRYPFGSLVRVLKYQERGYSIGKGDLLRIALCCHEIPLSSWDDLARAIGGQYGEKAKIDESEPFTMDAALKIFDNSDIMVHSDPEEMPGSADELLHKIGVRMIPDGEIPTDDKIPYAPAPPAPPAPVSFPFGG